MYRLMHYTNTMRRAVGSLLLLAFLILTINWLFPSRVKIPFWPRSSSLKIKETETVDGLRIDYVDNKGGITLAVDKNYATVIKTMDKYGNCIWEEYYNENGDPVVLPNGYSAIRKEYDINGNPTKMEFFDQWINPVINKQGYSIVLYTYDENENVETEMYFDNDMHPAKSISNRYGVRHEYTADGKESVVKNLAADGNLMTNTDSYVVTNKTYTTDGKLHTLMYYDEDGNPYRLSNGAYGYLYENRKSICLDSNGKRIFVLSHYLHNSKISVILAGAILLLLILISGRKINGLLFIAYFAFIIYMTILNRTPGKNAIYLTLPQNLYLLFTDRGFMMNIWLFIPLGAILYKLFQMWEIVAIPILITLAVETSQFVFGIGAFELTDLMANTFGGIIGVIGCYVLEPLVEYVVRALGQLQIKQNEAK